MIGNARFPPSDTEGRAQHLGGDPEWDIEFVTVFLCPLETTHKRRPIAGGVLAPGEKASGQLRRLVRTFDSGSKMNILHLFVAYGDLYNTHEILEKFRMLRHVYGLSVLTPARDGRTARALAVDSRKPFSDHLREAVAVTVEEERCLAPIAAQAPHSWPSVPVQEMERYTGLPWLQAAQA